MGYIKCQLNLVTTDLSSYFKGFTISWVLFSSTVKKLIYMKLKVCFTLHIMKTIHQPSFFLFLLLGSGIISNIVGYSGKLVSANIDTGAIMTTAECREPGSCPLLK